jgi:hypothetical protein
VARSTFRESLESFGAQEEEAEFLGIYSHQDSAQLSQFGGLALHRARVSSYHSYLVAIGLWRLVSSHQGAFEGYYHQYWLLL